MPVFREETFGPAAAVIRARDAEHAVELANDSDFGLGGNLWTRDLVRARELARRLESGGVFINGMTASDPRLPFGGVKRSGYGRELSLVGIREFVNVQTVWIGPAVSTPGAGGDAATCHGQRRVGLFFCVYLAVERGDALTHLVQRRHAQLHHVLFQALQPL